MNYEPDDPRLTAYALNELDEASNREIEAHLQEDPEARRMVEEIRATSALLSTELKKESAPKLHAGQRAAIQTVARVGSRTSPKKQPVTLRTYRPFVAAVAALLLVSVTMFWFTADERPSYHADMRHYGDAQKPAATRPAQSMGYDKAEIGDHLHSMTLAETSENEIGGGAFGNEDTKGAGWGGGVGGGNRKSSRSFGNPGDISENVSQKRAMSMGISRDEIEPRMKERTSRAMQMESGRELSDFSRAKNPQSETMPSDYVVPVEPPKPAHPPIEIELFKNEIKEKIPPASTPAKTHPIEPPREPAATPPPVSMPEKVLAGRVSLLTDEEKNAKKPNARPLDTQVLPVTETPVSGPAAPLNPLGYATPETKKPEIPLRYAPPQYQSYIQPTYNLPQSSEEYARVNDNTFRDTSVLEHRLSTFSADVDTAAYSNVRRFINQGQLPPADAVRIEEMVNYFKYDYTAPKDGKPFHVFMELAQCPWNPKHKLARIGVKAAEIEKNQRPASNLVFLIDVSGSMESEKKLPLVKKGLTALVENLNENDRVSIVTYASGTTLALPSTPCNQKGAIINAIRSLNAAGSTNGGDGIQRAYQQAAENFLRGGVNRVILATDGDFNVGITDQAQLTELIEAKAKEGVFLTVLGYGMGNLKDAKLELLADKGNGHYAYIDTDAESRRVLVDQLSGTLVTVAKDVKFQVEFNPSRVRAHRLVGYENRILAHADFNNDAKDAGEIGAGHIVTALYEIVPTRNSVALPGTDPLRYQPAEADVSAQLAQSEELLMLKIRYKLHNQDTSSLLEFPVQDNATSYGKASKDFKFSAAVAGFGMLLRGSPFRGNSTFESILELGGECVNGVPERKEFIELVQKARDLRR